MNQLLIDGELTGYTSHGASKTNYGRLARTFLIAMFIGVIVPVSTSPSRRYGRVIFTIDGACGVLGLQPADRSKPSHPAPANTRNPPSGNSLASPVTTSDPSTTREPWPEVTMTISPPWLSRNGSR